jgi:Ca-activated chloride channel homolog
MNRTVLIFASAAGLLAFAFLFGARFSSTETVATIEHPAGGPPVPVPAIVPTPPEQQKPGSLSFSAKLSQAAILPTARDVFAVLDIAGVDVPDAQRAPVNAALVIDCSGSMAGNKLRQAKSAAERYINLLNPTDRLAIVTYSNDTNSFEGRFATDDNKSAMLRFVRSISEGGGTNLEAGLLQARRVLSAAKSDFSANRIVLLSDGQPTIGATRQPQLSSLAAQLHSAGFSVTALGLGGDVNEDLLDSIAQVGGGAYGFAGGNDTGMLSAFFEKDLAQASTLVARGVSLDLTLPQGVSVVDVYGRSFETRAQGASIALNDFSARQREKVVIRLQLSGPRTESSLDIGTFALRYEDVLQAREAFGRTSLSLLVTDDQRFVDMSRDKTAFVDAAKALTGMNLRRAAQALAQGDEEEAQRSVRANAPLLQQAVEVGGVEAVKDQVETNDSIFGLAAAPAAPAVRQEQAKAVKSKALKAFGRGESVH